MNIGDRYGYWEIISEKFVSLSGKQNRMFVSCFCTKCKKNIVDVRVDVLKLKKSKHCVKCNGSSKIYKKEYKGIYENLFVKMQKEARNRKIPFSISMKQLGDLFERQKGLCAITNLPLILKKDILDRSFTASVDRKDSSLGYIYGNIQWVHKKINMMKGTLNQIEFIEFCKKVANNNIK